MRLANQTPRVSPAFLGWDLGGVVVRRVDEIDMSPTTSQWLLPDATPEHLQTEWLRPDFTDGSGFAMHVHIFAVEINGMRVLVDTGIGNDKTRQIPDADHLQTPLVHALTAAGFAPDTVDLVITTHMHIDHVGWNTHLVNGDWLPTFPNARYLADRQEWDYWTATALIDEEVAQTHRDSLQPIHDNGLYDLLDIPATGLEVADGIWLLPTRGHTPGHLSVKLTGTDHGALISGDSLHHPVQLAHPDITTVGDVDPDQALATRHSLLAELADTDDLLLGTHFAHPTAGRVRREGDRYRLQTEPPSLLAPTRPSTAQATEL